MGWIMKLLLCGGAAMALCVGLAGGAVAQVEVKDSPIHAVPNESAAGDDARPGPMARPESAPDTAPAAAVADSSPVAPAPTAPGAALSQDETTFFASLGRRITDSASAYESFVRRAGAIDPAFHDAAGVRAALQTGSDYQPRQFQEGIVAFAALLALRDEAFVDGVRAQDDPNLAERLTADPRSVLAIPGADRAGADVTAVLRAQGAALEARGAAITQAAYDVQAHPWSRQPVADSAQALAAEKAAAVSARSASEDSEKLLLHTVLTSPQGGASSDGQVSPQVLRGLALAALAIRGRTGDREEARFQGLMHDEISAACLNMVKMNLDQCLAAAGPHYEHVFCVGRHAVGETAKCVSAAATADGAPAQPPRPRLQTASVERYGPEAAASYGYPAPRADDEDQAPPPAAAAPAGYDRRRGGEAEDAYDRGGPPADNAPAYARGYAHTYTQAYAQPYGQAYARAYGGPPQGGSAQDRYPAPQDDRYRDADPDPDRYAAPDPDPRYADPRQPW